MYITTFRFHNIRKGVQLIFYRSVIEIVWPVIDQSTLWLWSRLRSTSIFTSVQGDLNGWRLKWYNNLFVPFNRIIILWFKWWNRRKLIDLTWPIQCQTSPIPTMMLFEILNTIKNLVMSFWMEQKTIMIQNQ